MRTNICCPNCNRRLFKTTISKVYECEECGDRFRKKGNYLEYDDNSEHPQRFSLKYYRYKIKKKN